MKKVLHTAFGCSLVLLIACNGGNNATSNDASGADTSAAVSDNTNSANNIATKNGLPLGPDQEVPANNSSGKGTADVSYNKETKTLTYTVNYSGLSEKASMAHIHGTAPRGQNAGVKHDLTGKLQKEVSGSFTDSVKIDASGIVEDSLLNGFYYFNIHTPTNPGGEIRGQIEF